MYVNPEHSFYYRWWSDVDARSSSSLFGVGIPINFNQVNYLRSYENILNAPILILSSTNNSKNTFRMNGNYHLTFGLKIEKLLIGIVALRKY